MGALTRSRIVQLTLAGVLLVSSLAQGKQGTPKKGLPGVNAALKMKKLFSITHNHFETRELLDRTRQDHERTIDSVGEIGEWRMRQRKLWVPFAGDPQLRKLTVRSVLQRMRADSKKLKEQIKKAPNAAVWDVLFVGAGPNSATTANALAHATIGDPMSVLTIEAGDMVSSNFARLGNTFGRNSSSRAALEGQQLQRGRGDKNPSFGVWGDPDLAGGEYPGVGGFADVATTNLFTSGSDVVLSSKVTKVRRSNGGPAKYEIETADGLKVYANKVVLATGFQAKDLDLGAASNELIAKERAKVDWEQPEKVPGIVTVAEALGLANLSQTGRDPYRGAPVKKAANPAPSTPVETPTVAFDSAEAKAQRVAAFEKSYLALQPGARPGAFAPYEDIQFDGATWTLIQKNGNRQVLPKALVTYGRNAESDPAFKRSASATAEVGASAFDSAEAKARRVAAFEKEYIANTGRVGNFTSYDDIEFDGTSWTFVAKGGGRQTFPAAQITYCVALRNDPIFNRKAVVQVSPNGFDSDKAKLARIAILDRANGATYGQSYAKGFTQAGYVDAYVEGGVWFLVNRTGQVAQFNNASIANGAKLVTDPRFNRQLAQATTPSATAGTNVVSGLVKFESTEAAAERLDAFDRLYIAKNKTASLKTQYSDCYREGNEWVFVGKNGGAKTRYTSQTLNYAVSIENQDLFNRDLAARTTTTATTTTKPVVTVKVPRVAVIGGKDSGRTFLEYMFGLSDESAYTGAGKRDVAQRGEVADVEWVVGQDGPADCAEFLQTTRSRYLRLAGKVREVDGKEPKARLVKARLTGVGRIASGEDEGRFQLTYSNGKTSIVDKVILANGVEARPSDLLDAGMQLETVRGKVPGLSGERTLAKKVAGEDIFVQGAAAGTDVAGADEVYSTNENAASVFNFAPRNRVMAETVLSQGQRVQKPFDSSFLGRQKRQPLKSVGVGGSSPYVINRMAFDALARLTPTSLKTVALKHDLAEILDEFRYPGMSKLTLTIAASGENIVVSSPDLDGKSVEAIGKAIAGNSTLVYELGGVIATKRPITIRADLRNADNTKVTDANRKGIVTVGSLRLEL